MYAQGKVCKFFDIRLDLLLRPLIKQLLIGLYHVLLVFVLSQGLVSLVLDAPEVPAFYTLIRWLDL